MHDSLQNNSAASSDTKPRGPMTPSSVRKTLTPNSRPLLHCAHFRDPFSSRSMLLRSDSRLKSIQLNCTAGAFSNSYLSGLRGCNCANQVIRLEVQKSLSIMRRGVGSAIDQFSKKHCEIVCRMHQPLTARQISKKLGLPLGTCSHALRSLSRAGFLVCLNPNAIRSRLYWLTKKGERCQKRKRSEGGLPRLNCLLPSIDWELYGWVCHSHRSAVIKALSHAMQPSEIKRRARSMNNNLRMSANNVRDITYLMLPRGIIRAVQVKRRTHLRYELTECGSKFRSFLMNAELF